MDLRLEFCFVCSGGRARSRAASHLLERFFFSRLARRIAPVCTDCGLLVLNRVQRSTSTADLIDVNAIKDCDVSIVSSPGLRGCKSSLPP